MAKKHKHEPIITWVVYRRTMMLQKKQFESTAVCEQTEWDILEQSEPGVRTLVRANISTEEEAEKLARGTSGDDYRSRTAHKS